MKYSQIIFAGFIFVLYLNFGLTVAEARCTGTAIFNGVHNHSLTVYGSTTVTYTFNVGDTVNDTVFSGSSDGTQMDFTWFYPNGSTARDTTVTGAPTETFTVYSDNAKVDYEGEWKINVSECNSTGATLANSSVTFSVKLPEFSKFGAFLPVFAAGLIYVSMRKKTLKK